MIFLHESDNRWETLSSEEKQRIMEKYFAWVRKLREANQMRGGDPLAPGGRVLKAANGSVVDGPFTESKEVVTGYFMIEASSLDEAAHIARECPALGHGETVIVRQIAEMDASGNH
jgi:hypothetical protein